MISRQSDFASTYSAVLQFYGKQAQLLDANRFVEYANTFTPDGKFQHTPGRPAAMRTAGIVEELVSFNRKFDNDPVQRRHWFDMVDVVELQDGTLQTTFYALVITTRPGNKIPVLGPSCVVSDILVFIDGQLKTRSRTVSHDHLDSNSAGPAEASK
jgi:actinorhodin biosynthesis protein ActVIA